MKKDAFHILWYVNLYLYMDLMACEINTNTFLVFVTSLQNMGMYLRYNYADCTLNFNIGTHFVNDTSL
jgi:hypothetical protein